MSLYNMVFGTNKAAPVLLKILGVTADDVPRFRDCFLSEGKIVIHTRTGGGNRKDYEDGNQLLQANQHYISDAYDDFDSTYANFYFRIPEEYAGDLKALVAKDENNIPSEKWRLLIEGLRS